MPREWSGTGPEFSVPWGGADWSLRVDGEHPGLTAPGTAGHYLGLAGVAVVGRWEPLALSAMSLQGYEIRLGRVEATYAPEGWHGLRVRAAWWPSDFDGIDLEVQLQASSVGELRLVEVQTLTVTENLGPRSWSAVTPRDPIAAAASYDGREPDLARLATGVIARDKGLWQVAEIQREGRRSSYAEMIRPGDWARRIREGGNRHRALRQALFGYDLEKGVVLRAHLRAVWSKPEKDGETIDDQFRRFLAEPPALGT